MTTIDVRLANPLDSYQSYSIQYVLLVARSTEAASEFLASNSSDKEFLNVVNETTALGQAVRSPSGKQDVYLVIDTRRFSQFTIENLKYDVFINGLHTNASPANLATDLTMTVLDAVGISFSNYLQWLMDKQLKCNFDGMIFMLRTLFVGHNDKGTTTVVHSETIPMHLFKVELDLNYAKGAYALEFMPNMNFDIRKHHRFLTISTATKFSTAAGANKLGDMVSSLETVLNAESAKYFGMIQNSLNELNQKSGETRYGRLVQYAISIPDKWTNYPLTGVSDGDAIEILYKADKDKATEQLRTNAQLSSFESAPPGAGITDVLTRLFVKCSDIAKLGNFQQSEYSVGYVTFFKFIVGITSTDEILTVHVDVVEFTIPKISPEQKATAATVNEERFYKVETMKDGTKMRVPLNYFTYDFIYTGINKDVLNLDVKIQDLQYLLAANLKIGPAAMAQISLSSGEFPEAERAAKALLNLREYDAILMPLDTTNTLTAFSNLAKTLTAKKNDEDQAAQQQYTKNLSMFYAASPIVLAMTIRGNPMIMHKFNMGIMLDGAKKELKGSPHDKKAYRAHLEKLLSKDYTRTSNGQFTGGSAVLNNDSYVSSPVFVKVNIKGPAVDFVTGTPKNGDKYTTSVISDNYFTVFKVTNNIQGSVFTQDLELYMHNIFGAADKKEEKKESKVAK